MDDKYDFDLAVIGAGSAGFAAARAAAANGLKVAVLEGGEEVGGLCILRGCMPTKALLYASEVLHLAQHSKVWGLIPGEIGFDFKAVMARKDAMVREFASYRQKQLLSSDFAFMRARARFTDTHRLVLSNGRELTAQYFIVATGSSVAPPPLTQLSQAGYLDSDAALRLERLPRSLIVLGGGAVGVEFAQFFARLGVKVTLIQRSKHLLKEFDEDAALVVQNVFRREGITLYTKTQLIDAGREGQTKSVTFQQDGKTHRVEAEEILFALGRVANTAGLNLDQIGVSCNNGRIIADATMQTTVPHIYAVGDCTGQHEIVHIAIQQAEVAAYNISHQAEPRRIDYRMLTTVIFTDPQLANVGISKQEADVQNIPYAAAQYPFDDHGKSILMEAKDGFVRLLASPKSGEILGGCCVGPMAGELVHVIIAALAKRMTVHELAAMPYYHPTLSEIWSYPAEELAGAIVKSYRSVE